MSLQETIWQWASAFALLSLQGAEATPKVTAVLSEGEQRALSLAFFLAEMGAADHDGGIVLDDPVSHSHRLPRQQEMQVRLPYRLAENRRHRPLVR